MPTELKLTEEQEREVEQIAYEMLMNIGAHAKFARELVALRAVAEAATVIANESDYDPPMEPHPKVVLRTALRAAGRDV